MNPFMQRAIELSLENVRSGAGGPFAAVVVKDGAVLATGANQVTSALDPTAHAEIVAIRGACRALRSFQLSGCELYTTCEPCPMCMGAIYWARLAKVYYANTRADAAKIGFDDSLIYDQLALPIEARKIAMVQIMRDRGAGGVPRVGAVPEQDTVLVLVRELLKRWLPAASMMLVSVLSYVDRNTLALLAPTILKDTRMSVTEYGWVVSAYSVLFTIGNPLWGKILDRIGLRRGMSAAVALWTLASASHAWAGGFWSFAAARAALGLGEGAASPGGLRTVVQTLPASSRSRGMALTFSGGSAGAILTPLLMTPVAEAWGWRAAFWFTGLLGALWVLGWLVLSRRPDVRKIEAPAASAADDAGEAEAQRPTLLGLLAGVFAGRSAARFRRCVSLLPHCWFSSRIAGQAFARSALSARTGN